MESKKIMTGNQGMISGVKKVAETVKVTLGPKGKCVAIQDGFDTPLVTRDGATVAKNIHLEDPIEEMGAQIVKKAAQNTEESAGDGTSTSCVLTEELIRVGQKYLGSGDYNLNEVRDGMEKCQKEIVKGIKDSSIEVRDDLEKIRKVATISANNDPEVGDLIVEGMKKVGIDGALIAEMSSGLETTIDVKEGFRIDRGWASPHFVTSAKDGVCELSNPVILVVGEKLSTIPQIQGILMQLADPQTGAIKNPILIIADDVDEVILTMLVVNVLNRALSCCVVKGIDFGDNRKNIMQDIATAVGAQFICQENNLKMEDATIDLLGTADRVVIDKDSCTIFGGAGDPTEIQERIEILKARLDDEQSDYQKQKFQKRLSCLAGGIAVLKAGGASEVEKKNRKDTIEDAILASKSAVEEGIVAGGGLTLYKLSSLVPPKTLGESERVGWKIVMGSLPVITRTIAENSGISGEVVLETLKKNSKKDNFGYNAKTGTYGNLLEEGVVDSAKVLRCAIENSISAASMVLLTAKTITFEEKDKKIN